VTCSLLKAQCSDSTTMFYKVTHLSRTSSNNVEALAGTQVIGNYYAAWRTSVSTTESGPSGVIHSGSASVAYGGNDDSGVAGGTYSHLLWNGAPSFRGAGTYSLSNSHTWVSTCLNTRSDTSSSSLAVNKPTITRSLSAFWNLGGSGLPSICSPMACSTTLRATAVKSWSLLERLGMIGLRTRYTQMDCDGLEVVFCRYGHAYFQARYDSPANLPC
jgi:hypothetical protein